MRIRVVEYAHVLVWWLARRRQSAQGIQIKLILTHGHAGHVALAHFHVDVGLLLVLRIRCLLVLLPLQRLLLDLELVRFLLLLVLGFFPDRVVFDFGGGDFEAGVVLALGEGDGYV